MDLIAAIATGGAACAIGVIRLSGDGCFAACGQVFRPANGRPFSQQEPRKLVLGEGLSLWGGCGGGRLERRYCHCGQLLRGSSC